MYEEQDYFSVSGNAGHVCSRRCSDTHAFAHRPFRNYYWDYKLTNPALTGTRGRHVITTSYLGRWDSYDGLYGSYEANIPSIKSGVGATATYENLLGVNKLYHVGGLYSREFGFNESSGLRVGAHIYYQNNSVDTDAYQINANDPLIFTGRYKNGRVGVDFGLLYYVNKFTFGASVNSISIARWSDGFVNTYSDATIFNFLASKELPLTSNLEIVPSCLLVTDMHDIRINVNSTFKVYNLLLVGVGSSFIRQEAKADFNAGVNFKDRVQLIMHFYSSIEDRYRDYRRYFETMVRVTIPDRE